MDDVDGAAVALGEYFFKAAGLLIPHITVAIAAYISGRAGRKVKVKFGEVEVEADTIEEVEQVLKLVENSRARSTVIPPTT